MTATGTETGLHRLAPSQQTIWEFSRALMPDDPGAACFPVVDFRLLHGPLSVPALRAALADVAQRHEILRVTFEETGDEPRLRVHPSIELPLTVVDLTAVDQAGQDDALDDIAHRERFCAFDLHNGPLWSVHLIATGPRTHVLTMSFFHVISDGWSNRVFVQDLVHAYEARLGRRAPLPPLALGLADVARIQGERLADNADSDAYWREHLLPLPTSELIEPRRTTPGTDFTAEVSHRFAFTAGSVTAMRAVAWRARTTPFTVTLAAYAVLMCVRSERSRVVVGTTTLGRDDPASRLLIGQFTNNVYLDIRVEESDTFADVLGAVHRTMADAVTNVSSFNRLARAVNPSFDRERPWSFLKVFDCWFQSGAPAVPDLLRPDLRVEQVDLSGERAIGRGPSFPDAGRVGSRAPVWARRGVPVVIVDDDRGGGITVSNRDFYDQDFVATHTACYVSALHDLVDAPDEPALEVVRSAVGRTTG